MGVAVIDNKLVFSPLLSNRFLCVTPNLCCSSMTTIPNELKTTLSSNNACVPTRISTIPFFKFVSISFLFFCGVLPVRSSTETKSGFKNCIKFL